MAKKIRTSTGIIDCACVIHSTGYDWTYVERLYNMLTRNLPNGIRFHVYTEHDRSVPPHLIKHILQDWPGISGPKRSWWHKLQLFNPEHHAGNLLYFDLDTVIVRDVSWITQLDSSYLWGIKDFRYLQNPVRSSINSSVMWWNVTKFATVWDDFKNTDVAMTTRRYPGDQDYLSAQVGHNKIRYLDQDQIKSWRWQCMEGGYDFQRRKHREPGTPAQITGDTSIIVFHGTPKPHTIKDNLVKENWK